MEVVSVLEARRALSQLVNKALNGETIYIGDNGKAQAMLAPVSQMGQVIPKKIGVLAGELNVPEDFDDELSSDVVF